MLGGGRLIEAIFICEDGHVDKPIGFTIKGHAQYAQNGSDIVCSAVSALTFGALEHIKKSTVGHEYVFSIGANDIKFELYEYNFMAIEMLKFLISALEMLKTDQRASEHVAIHIKEADYELK